MVDWEDMLRHLVRSEKHIACPSCGQEFKSVGGMERHAKQVGHDVELFYDGSDADFA